MAEPGRTKVLSVKGDSFAGAIEQVLDAVIRLTFITDQDSTRSARFQSEGTTSAELVGEAIVAVTSLAVELEMAIVAVRIDGLRPTDGGHRCWGTVELAPAAVEQNVTIVDGPHVSRDPGDGRWRIDLALGTD